MDLCVVDKGSVFVGFVNAILTHLELFRALIVSVMIGLVQKQGKNKRYFKIDQNLARHFKYDGACLFRDLLPFYAFKYSSLILIQ